jgi:hypothetical protein
MQCPPWSVITAAYVIFAFHALRAHRLTQRVAPHNINTLTRKPMRGNFDRQRREFPAAFRGGYHGDRSAGAYPSQTHTAGSAASGSRDSRWPNVRSCCFVKFCSAACVHRCTFRRFSQEVIAVLPKLWQCRSQRTRRPSGLNKHVPRRRRCPQVWRHPEGPLARTTRLNPYLELLLLIHLRACRGGAVVCPIL